MELVFKSPSRMRFKFLLQTTSIFPTKITFRDLESSSHLHPSDSPAHLIKIPFQRSPSITLKYFWLKES